MRAMFLEFPEDRTSWLVDQQYMLGGHLLVAPVMGETDVEYYLPKGLWTNILTGGEVEGSRWIKESHTMATLPLLLRPGSALIIGKPGHLVTDSISNGGFTVIVARQCFSEIKVTSTLRDGKEITVTISPEVVGGKVSSLKVNSSDKVEFDVLIVGGDKGLFDGGWKSGVSKAGTCSIVY